MGNADGPLLRPLLTGADVELGNFLESEARDGYAPLSGTGYEASRELLAQIKGQPERAGLSSWWAASPGSQRTKPESYSGNGYTASAATHNPQDVGRRFLESNGSSAYLDLDHLELCIPEVISAFDHVAASHAMLRIARGALDRANQNRPPGQRVRVLVNNSDGLGNSYGSHLNFMISRRLFDDIFARKPHYLQFLASYQVSSLILTGQGKVGSENYRAPVPYQLSQRADFFTTLKAIQTTFDRPICNERDESSCGRSLPSDASAPARLHVIFFDSALGHGSALARVGNTQLVLVLMELGLINPRLLLDDPLEALESYSRDPSLKATAQLITHRRLTALELQSAYLEEVKRYAAEGVFEDVVPRWAEIIELWEDMLNKLTGRDWPGLANRGVDWVLKLMSVERAMDQRPDLDWGSPDIKMIDLMYSSLDDGLYFAYEASGLAHRLVPEERITYFTANPPTDTRAYARAILLRRAKEEGIEVTGVDWDRITFKAVGNRGWPCYRTFDMPDPLSLTQDQAQPVFDACSDFDDLLEGLESLADDRAPAPISNPRN